MTLSDEYIAGFFDGEGCATIIPVKQPNGRIFLKASASIAQNRREVLDLIAEKHGGSVNPQNGGRNYFYIAENKLAEGLLKAIYPHTIVKKHEIEIVLEFCATKTRRYSRTGIPPEVQAQRDDCVRRLKLVRAQ